MELSGIHPPVMRWEDSNLPEAWEKFQRHAGLMFSGPLKRKGEEEQISYLLLWVGEKGRDIHATWTLGDDEKKKLQTYYDKFKAHVQPKLNPIFARYKFNHEIQGADTIDRFIKRLRLVARDCNFAPEEHDNLLRDRVVFGTNSNKLREKLINIGADLTLDKAIQTAQSLEYSQEQLRSMTQKDVDFTQQQPKSTYNKGPKRQTSGATGKSTRGAALNRTFRAQACSNCGAVHKYGDCPARGKKCLNCDKFNHYAKVCRSKHTHGKINSVCENVTDAFQEFQIDTVSTFNSPDRALVNISLGPSKNVVSFKVDTGSAANILPLEHFKSLHISAPLEPPSSKLTSYTGNEIQVLGKIMLQCHYKGKTVETLFHVVDTPAMPLLSLKSSVDLDLVKLAYAVDDDITRLCTEQVMSDYGELFKGIGEIPGVGKLHLKEGAIPVVNPPRRVPEALKSRLHDELNRMESNKIIAKVDMPTDWVNSLVVVEKPKTGQLRICLDPKALNEAIRRPHYPMQTLDDVTTQLAGCKYFSLLDITHAYWSIRLDDESSYLTTFSTPFGRYRYLRLPFGISSSQDIFVKKVNEIFEGLPGVATIVDDILIYGKSREEHDRNVINVLERARAKGIRFNPDKCRIGLKEVPFFGHMITSDGLKPDPAKIQAISQIAAPTNRTELENLLGMVNYLQKFAPNLSDITSPLRSLLKKDIEFLWDQPQEDAFREMKKVISKSPVLAYFDPNKPVTLECDASLKGLGAAVLQDGRPVAFASKSLTPTEQNYANIEREMLAILFACTKFHQYIYGRPAIVHSDHKPLSSIMKKPLSAAPPRLQRMMLQLSKYDLDVQYVRGKEVPVSDLLSRKPMSDSYEIEGLDLHVHTVLKHMTYTDRSLENVRQTTKTDAQMKILKQTIYQGWPELRSQCDDSVLEFFNHRDELTVSDDLVFRGQTLVIPQTLRQHMLEQIHIGHMGTEKTIHRARDVMFWPGMTKQITDYILNCSVCLKYRNSNQKEPLTPHEIPPGPWQDVATDLFHFDDCNYLLTVDYYSRYFEIDRLQDTLSSTVVRKLKARFSVHGIPIQLFSDNGPQYTSQTFQTFTDEWGINHVTSSPLHPISNGLAERTVQTVKRILKKAKESGHDPYLSILEYKNTPLNDSKVSPVQMLMGRRTRSILPTTTEQLMPKVVKPEYVRPKMQTSKNKQKRHYDKTAKPLPRLNLNESVNIQIGKIWKPAKVISVHDNHSYVVQTSDGGVYRRNRKRLSKTKAQFPDIVEFAPNVLAESQMNNKLSSPHEPLNSHYSPTVTASNNYQTRSGRVVQPNKYYTSSEWTK